MKHMPKSPDSKHAESDREDKLAMVKMKTSIQWEFKVFTCRVMLGV